MNDIGGEGVVEHHLVVHSPSALQHPVELLAQVPDLLLLQRHLDVEVDSWVVPVQHLVAGELGALAVGVFTRVELDVLTGEDLLGSPVRQNILPVHLHDHVLDVAEPQDVGLPSHLFAEVAGWHFQVHFSLELVQQVVEELPGSLQILVCLPIDDEFVFADARDL